MVFRIDIYKTAQPLRLETKGFWLAGSLMRSGSDSCSLTQYCIRLKEKKNGKMDEFYINKSNF